MLQLLQIVTKVYYKVRQVLQSVRQENKKQGEAPGKIWEIPKESGETIGER